MKKESIPEIMCFVASLGFIGGIIPTVMLTKPVTPMSVLILLVAGLFFFTLSLIMNLLMRIDRLEKLNNISQKEST